MEKSTVALVPADSYDQDKVDAAVRKGLELLGVGLALRCEAEGGEEGDDLGKFEGLQGAGMDHTSIFEPRSGSA